jgi:hypothetical protein
MVQVEELQQDEMNLDLSLSVPPISSAQSANGQGSNSGSLPVEMLVPMLEEQAENVQANIQDFEQDLEVNPINLEGGPMDIDLNNPMQFLKKLCLNQFISQLIWE